MTTRSEDMRHILSQIQNVRTAKPINELFDQNGRIDWIQRDDQTWKGTFDVGDLKFAIVFSRNGPPQFNKREEWTIYFVSLVEGEGPSFDNTGLAKQASISVFSHVVMGVRQFLREIKPISLFFTGEKSLGKASLYATIARYLSKDVKNIGYSVLQTDTGSGASFEIRRDESSL